MTRARSGADFSTATTLGIDALERCVPQVILTANLGLPTLLNDITARLPESAAVVHVDAANGAVSRRDFFRAPAHLVLPEWSPSRVVVAVVVRRPGGKSAELICSRCYDWPEEVNCALKALERFILAYVDQWRPPRALWHGPAEELLPEVLPNEASGSSGGR